jgi:hypothetical protein
MSGTEIGVPVISCMLSRVFCVYAATGIYSTIPCHLYPPAIELHTASSIVFDRHAVERRCDCHF